MTRRTKSEINTKKETAELLFDSPIFSTPSVSVSLAPDALDNEFEKLKFLALHYDPYQGQAIELKHETQCQTLLEEFELIELLDRPFDLTNRLLQLLDRAEQKLKRAGRPLTH